MFLTKAVVICTCVLLKHPWFLAGLYIFLFIPIHGKKYLAALNFWSSWFPQSFNLCQVSYGWLGISYPYDYVYIYVSTISPDIPLSTLKHHETSLNHTLEFLDPRPSFKSPKKKLWWQYEGASNSIPDTSLGAKMGTCWWCYGYGWYGSCSLVCELWQHSDENMRHQESPRMKKIVANSETVCDSPGEVHNQCFLGMPGGTPGIADHLLLSDGLLQ